MIVRLVTKRLLDKCFARSQPPRYSAQRHALQWFHNHEGHPSLGTVGSDYGQKALDRQSGQGTNLPKLLEEQSLVEVGAVNILRFAFTETQT